MTNALIKYSALTEVISKPDGTYIPNSTVVHFKTLFQKVWIYVTERLQRKYRTVLRYKRIQYLY